MVTGARCLREKSSRRILSDHKSEALSLGLFLTALIWTGSGLCYGSTVSFLSLSHRSLYHPLPSSLSALSPPFQTIDRSPLSLERVFISRRLLLPFMSVCFTAYCLACFLVCFPLYTLFYLHKFFSVCLTSYFFLNVAFLFPAVFQIHHLPLPPKHNLCHSSLPSSILKGSRKVSLHENDSDNNTGKYVLFV